MSKLLAKSLLIIDFLNWSQQLLIAKRPTFIKSRSEEQCRLSFALIALTLPRSNTYLMLCRCESPKVSQTYESLKVILRIYFLTSQLTIKKGFHKFQYRTKQLKLPLVSQSNHRLYDIIREMNCWSFGESGTPISLHYLLGHLSNHSEPNCNKVGLILSPQQKGPRSTSLSRPIVS